MNKINIEKGRSYRGWGTLNEYGEWFFRPEQKGTRPSNMKVVMETDFFKLYEGKHHFKVTMNFEKAGFDVTRSMQRVLTVVSQIKQYLR